MPSLPAEVALGWDPVLCQGTELRAALQCCVILTPSTAPGAELHPLCSPAELLAVWDGSPSERSGDAAVAPLLAQQIHLHLWNWTLGSSKSPLYLYAKITNISSVVAIFTHQTILQEKREKKKCAILSHNTSCFLKSSLSPYSQLLLHSP